MSHLKNNEDGCDGSGFGIEGDNYVRFSLIENEQRIRQAVRGIKNILGN